MQLKTIPVGIVGIKSNTVRAYVAVMEQYGLRPRSIIIMKDPLSAKARLFARLFGTNNTAKLLFHRKLKKMKFIKKFQRSFQNSFQLKFDFFSSVEYVDKCSNYYEVYARNINDSQVIQCIKDSQEDVFIYGGGGIVKDPVFELGIKIIHTHPGYLPFVRGSHGIFWSLLVRNKFGCSTFYMSRGIDLGEIILRKEYERSVFPEVNESPATIEKLLNFYVDPLIRAKTLIDVLLNHLEYEALECQKQDTTEGESYYYMQDLIRLRIAASLQSGEICLKK